MQALYPVRGAKRPHGGRLPSLIKLTFYESIFKLHIDKAISNHEKVRFHFQMNYSSYHTARLIEISSQIEHVHYEFDYLSKLLLSCLRTKKSITKLLNFVKSGATNQKVCLSIISNIYIFICIQPWKKVRPYFFLLRA